MGRTGLESQEELIKQAKALASKTMANNRFGEANIIESNALLIESNARVEGHIENLINVIKDFNKKTEKFNKQTAEFNTDTKEQTRLLIRLTWAIAGLTVILVIGLGIQIYIS